MSYRLLNWFSENNYGAQNPIIVGAKKKRGKQLWAGGAQASFQIPSHLMAPLLLPFYRGSKNVVSQEGYRI